MRAVYRLFLTASATVAVTVAAQASPTTFSLPEPTPTPTAQPDVAGPADDTGIVPIAPRVIPTDSPTPTVSPSPSAAAPSSPATASPADEGSDPIIAPATVLPTATPTPAATQPSAAIVAPDATPRAVPQPSEPEASASEGIPGLEGAIDFVPEQATGTPSVASEPSAASDGMFDYWPWLAGLAALLALGIVAFAFARRRKPVQVATIERPRIEPEKTVERPPAAPNSKAPPPLPAANPRVDIALDVVSATRSVMQFTLDYRLTLANREAQAVRDIDVTVILTSARSNSTPPGKLGYDQAEPNRVERIGPSKSHVVSGTLQLPVSQLQIMRQGNKPLFIPLVQITVGHGEGEPVTRHYAIGLPSAASASRVHPIPLDTPPGGIPDLRTRKLDLQPG